MSLQISFVCPNDDSNEMEKNFTAVAHVDESGIVPLGETHGATYYVVFHMYRPNQPVAEKSVASAAFDPDRIDEVQVAISVANYSDYTIRAELVDTSGGVTTYVDSKQRSMKTILGGSNGC